MLHARDRSTRNPSVSGQVSATQAGARHPVAVPIQTLDAAPREIKLRLVATAHLVAGAFCPTGPSQFRGERRGGGGRAEFDRVLADERIVFALNRRDVLIAGLFPGIGRVPPRPGGE